MLYPMYRRTTTAALMLLCLAAAVWLAPAQAMRKYRAGRVLSDLYCRTEYEDALRACKQLRGPEREAAREAARKRYIECHHRAKRAHQPEDVMPRLIPR